MRLSLLIHSQPQFYAAFELHSAVLGLLATASPRASELKGGWLTLILSGSKLGFNQRKF